jgi:microcin C transport system substrate-binding protein
MRSFLGHVRRRAGRALAGGLMLAALASAAPAQENVITAHGISVFGELKYPEGFAHLDYVNPDAPKGGEMSVWASGGFDTINPYSIKGRAAGLSSIFFETLLEGTADEVDSAYGLLAESLEYPEDRSWVIFNIRPEAHFSDGTPVTAEDVVFSYETLRDKGLASFRAIIQKQVDRAEVLGPLRVKYTFKTGIPTRDLPLSVGGLPVFQKKYFVDNAIDFEETTLIPAVGSGPYLLDSMKDGQTITYRRDPNWWGADLPLNRGRYNFETIRIVYYTDYAVAFEGFKAGTYTFRVEASSLYWATGYDFPAVDKGWVVKRALPDGSLAPSQAFVFNLRRAQFQDPRVRQAIGMMFNFEWSNKTLFYGVYQRVNSFWDNSDMAASGLPSAEELAILEPMADILPPGVLTEPAVMAPVSGERQLDRGNLRAASAILDEAGWTVGADGLRRNAQGQTLSLEIINESQTFDRVILPFVENLRRLGVDAKLTRIDDAQMTQRERSFNYDMIVANFPMSLTPGAGLKQYFGSETKETSTFNTPGYGSEAVDRLIEVVEAARTRDELKVAVRALDRVLRAERFWIPQWFNANHLVAYYDMFEHPDPLPPFALGNLDFWWYNADKAAALRAAGAL